MTPLAQALVGLLAMLGAGLLGRALARALPMRRAASPERPLGWHAAMAELDGLPELPPEGYSNEALHEELAASTVELDRWTAWVRAEPRDEKAKARIRALLPRHERLTAEMRRRADRDLALLQAKLDAMPPGPHDDVIEERTFGGGLVRSHVVRCDCTECLQRSDRPPDPGIERRH